MNRYHGEGHPDKGKARKSASQSPAKASMTMRTKNWPGAPGKTQGDRSKGYRKLKIHPVSKGL